LGPSHGELRLRLPHVATVFLDILAVTIVGDTIAQRGMMFFGAVQEPWYTVGYMNGAISSNTWLRYNEATAQSISSGGTALTTWDYPSR
jgi:hypothetical protein